MNSAFDGDEGDAAFIGLARIGIGRDGRFLIVTNLADVSFVDVGAQPDVIEVGERHHRRAGHHDLAKLRLADLDDAGERRAQHRIAEHDLRQFERFFGSVDIGLREVDLALGGVFERLIALMRGGRLPPGRVGLVARSTVPACFCSRKSARLYSASPEFEVGGVELDRRCAAVRFFSAAASWRCCISSVASLIATCCR